MLRRKRRVLPDATSKVIRRLAARKGGQQIEHRLHLPPFFPGNKAGKLHGRDAGEAAFCELNFTALRSKRLPPRGKGDFRMHAHSLERFHPLRLRGDLHERREHLCHRDVEGAQQAVAGAVGAVLGRSFPAAGEDHRIRRERPIDAKEGPVPLLGNALEGFRRRIALQKYTQPLRFKAQRIEHARRLAAHGVDAALLLFLTQEAHGGKKSQRIVNGEALQRGAHKIRRLKIIGWRSESVGQIAATVARCKQLFPHAGKLFQNRHPPRNASLLEGPRRLNGGCQARRSPADDAELRCFTLHSHPPA